MLKWGLVDVYKRQVKYLFLSVIRYSLSVIGYIDIDSVPQFFRGNINVRILRRIFDSIIHDIHDHLHDQLCIHPGHEELVLQVYLDFMSPQPPPDMAQSFAYHILEKLRLLLQFHAAVLYFGHGQQVLNQIIQPYGIVVNIDVYKRQLWNRSLRQSA